MRYVAAYLLAALGGNEHPTVANIESILGSVGVDVDATKAKMVVEKLKGKSIAELIAAGSDKLVAVVAGAAAAAPVAAAAPAAAAPAAAAKEDKKKKEEPEEEEEDMGFGLFD